MKAASLFHCSCKGLCLLAISVGLLTVSACVTSGSRSSFGTWHEHRLPTPESHVVSLPAAPSKVLSAPVFAPYTPPDPNDPTVQILQAQMAEAEAEALASGEEIEQPASGLMARLSGPRQIGSVTKVPLRTTAANYMKDEKNITLFTCQANGYAPRSPNAAGMKNYAEVVVENTLDLFAVRRALVLHELSQPIELTLDTTVPKHGSYSAAKTRNVIAADNQLFADVVAKLRLNQNGAWRSAAYDAATVDAASSRIPTVGAAAVVELVPVRVQ